MTQSIRDSIYDEIASIRLIDPHTHIDPHAPASSTLADILGYHYYTELAHSAGMPKDQIEEPGIGPRELVKRLALNLQPIENTANYRWLIELCRKFFGFQHDRINASNWESLYDSAESKMARADWSQMVLDQSNVESVFLTNDFDDDLEGFDSNTYIPCLRTDDLVFHLAKSSVQERLVGCSGIELDGSLASLRSSLHQRFEHFVGRGARACAISIPPTFVPTPVSDGRAASALTQVLKQGELADVAHRDALSRRVFWTLAELCDEFGLPFDLMIGVNRGVYPGGVYQGQDLYDSRVSLTQYRELFNAFPNVKFPVSVLASVTNQELVSHAWIFPNVITNGHWWYSNTPSFIARDAMARLEAVPQNKQIAYYSDAYKLEFVWPKFDMYRNVLADLLAEHFVGRCGWNEERAVELGRRILRDNVDEIFPARDLPLSKPGASDTIVEDPDATVDDILLAGSSAALAAGAIGMVEVDAADSVDDTLSMETVVEELADDSGDDQSDLADLPTQIEDNDETVRIEEEIDEDSVEFDLDPSPSDAEVDVLETSDVVISDVANEETVDLEDLQVDEPALDVGDLLSDSEVDPGLETVGLDDETMNPAITPLRNEDSFSPDEDSIQVKPDPLTGELKFNTPTDQNADDDTDDLLIDFLDDDDSK
ncbi:glucuronate isomerase [Rubripirellula obstinata]|uniref:Glucuronate isomerase n=1 Tax=Rubripirellula obstinata TaxID=406547 RepID=A0A5B1CKB7_9BACT|nr:glucuronate isomerase [Rubripirellula obstinata]KAA1260315.1 glucuronate isomerase [Rubripirellula obstinata]